MDAKGFTVLMLAAVPEGGAIMKDMGRGGDSLQMPRASCPHLIVYSIIKC